MKFRLPSNRRRVRDFFATLLSSSVDHPVTRTLAPALVERAKSYGVYGTVLESSMYAFSIQVQPGSATGPYW